MCTMPYRAAARMQDKSQAEQQEQKRGGYKSRLQNAVVNNLQFNLYNVHVRYEDTVTDPEVCPPSPNLDHSLMLAVRRVTASVPKQLEVGDQRWRGGWVG